MTFNYHQQAFDEINAMTGFANGSKFTSEQQVKDYFTLENLLETLSECSQDQNDLDQMAEAVIANKWHCEF